MEEFLKLNWSWKNPRCDEGNLKHFDVDFSEDEDIFYGHLNELDFRFLGKTSSDGKVEGQYVCKDPRNGQKIERFVKYISDVFRKPILYRNFPFKSCLTQQEHISCIEALLYLRRVCDSDEKIQIKNESLEMKTYLKLNGKIRDEIEKFKEFVKKFFLTRCLVRKKDINPLQESLFIEKWQREIQEAVLSDQELLNETYILATAVPIHCQEEQFKATSLKFIKELTRNGTPLKSILSYKKVSERLEARNGVHFLEKYYERIFGNHQISNEKLETALIFEEKIDVTMSTTSLQYLLSAYNEKSNDWLIPIEILDDEGLQSKTTVIVKDPLPFLKLTPLDRQYAIALDLVKAIYRKDLTRNENPDLKLNILAGEPPYILQRIEEYMTKFNSLHCSSKQDVPVKIFSIHNIFELSSKDQEILRLLIQTSPDAFNEDGEIFFSIKIEYQPEFGCEQMTKSELIKEWISLRFSPELIVKRIRMSFYTFSILHIRDITLKIVVDELQRLYSIKEETLLGAMYQLVTILQRFPTEKYFAKYEPAKKHSVSIFRQQKGIGQNSEQARRLNLSELYSKVQFQTSNLEEIDWTPIDTLEVSGIHMRSKVMPCMFPWYGKNVKPIVEKRRISATANKLQQKFQKKKKKRSNKTKLKAKLMKETDKEYECFDPKELFDASGNIRIIGLSEKKFHEKLKPEPISEVLDIQLYQNDANISSASSRESTPTPKKRPKQVNKNSSISPRISMISEVIHNPVSPSKTPKRKRVSHRSISNIDTSNNSSKASKLPLKTQFPTKCIQQPKSHNTSCTQDKNQSDDVKVLRSRNVTINK